jgi:hypothetical protein
MGRPKKEKTEQRQQIGFRLSPEDRQRLEAAAASSGRSVPQEVEERVLASLHFYETVDAPTRDLIANLLTEIATVQSLTGKRWHKDAATWAAVHQMFRQGPLNWVRPDRPHDDEIVSEIWRELNPLQENRVQLMRDLAEMGIAVLERPRIRKGLIGSYNSRDNERAAIEAIEDVAVRTRASEKFDAILKLDAEIDTIDARYTEALQPYWSAERSGRTIYQDHRKAVAMAAMRSGKDFFISDLMSPPELT